MYYPLSIAWDTMVWGAAFISLPRWLPPVCALLLFCYYLFVTTWPKCIVTFRKNLWSFFHSIVVFGLLALCLYTACPDVQLPSFSSDYASLVPHKVTRLVQRLPVDRPEEWTTVFILGM